MKARINRILCLLLASAVLFADGAGDTLKDIFEAHRWFDLRHAVTSGQRPASYPAFYRGALAVAFNDAAAAERLLHTVIRSNPRGDQARQAHDLLASLYLRNGRYREFQAEVNKKWAGLGQLVSEGDRSLMAAFDRLPDLYVARLKPSVMRFSESEARRLSLTIYQPRLPITGVDGSKAEGARTALADRLFIGNVELRNVSFLVLGDDSEPFASLPPGKRGLLGLPVLIALQTLRWTRDGLLEVGARSQVFRQRQRFSAHRAPTCHPHCGLRGDAEGCIAIREAYRSAERILCRETRTRRSSSGQGSNN